MVRASARSAGSILPTPSARPRAAAADRAHSIPASSVTWVRDLPRCALVAGLRRLAFHPAPANLRRVPHATPRDRPDARNALRTEPLARPLTPHPRTPGRLRSRSRTAPREPVPVTVAIAVRCSQLSFHPCSWHSYSWRPPPLSQPDLLIGRGVPPLKSQQPSGHRQES